MFDLHEARARVVAIAAERPTHQYSAPEGTCVYFDDGDVPSCLVGQAFPTELRAAGISYENGDNSCSIGRLAVPSGRLGGLFTAEAVDWLTAVQNAQDRGHTWGYAVERADEEFPIDVPDFVPVEWATPDPDDDGAAGVRELVAA